MTQHLLVPPAPPNPLFGSFYIINLAQHVRLDVDGTTLKSVPVKGPSKTLFTIRKDAQKPAFFNLVTKKGSVIHPGNKLSVGKATPGEDNKWVVKSEGPNSCSISCVSGGNKLFIATKGSNVVLESTEKLDEGAQIWVLERVMTGVADRL